jgi:hypothetical protein
MKFIKSLVLASALMLLIGSCVRDKFDGLQQNPNGPDLSAAREDLLLNSVQLNFNSVWGFFSNRGMELTRMELMAAATYGVAYSPDNFDGVWSDAYTGVIKNADEVIRLGRPKNLWYHLGVANVLKAYTYLMLVDNFGDVPFVEANQGTSGNTNPKYTPASQVYAGAIVLLDSAIAQIARTPSTAVPIRDLYYGSKDLWRTLAKTLKLRSYMNLRLQNPTLAATNINALLTEDDLIKTDAADFRFAYGNRFLNPNTRHPKYNNGYRAAGGATGYIANNYMYFMVEKKGKGRTFDPRTRYYFYRQNSFVFPSEDFISCYFTARPAHYPANIPYCYVNTGQYWGRDHGDNSGVPPDNAYRTVWGVYPAGGRYEDVPAAVNNNTGALGAGISPIWMSSFTDFVKAEAALTVSGAPGDAKALLLSGVRKSINRVISFPATIGYTNFNSATVPTSAQIDAYVDSIGVKYDAAATNTTKLDLILEEYYLALWGNGVESYNMYRRTSRPRGLQPTLASAPGTFIRSFFYPSVSVNLNINAQQKANMGVKVFWDTNPDPLF